jgi:hypothetical protein
MAGSAEAAWKNATAAPGSAPEIIRLANTLRVSVEPSHISMRAYRIAIVFEPKNPFTANSVVTIQQEQRPLLSGKIRVPSNLTVDKSFNVIMVEKSLPFKAETRDLVLTGIPYQELGEPAGIVGKIGLNQGGFVPFAILWDSDCYDVRFVLGEIPEGETTPLDAEAGQ